MIINVLRKIKKLLLLPYTVVAPVIGKTLCSLPSSARVFSEPHKQVFFGYFDVSPISADGKTLLACRAPEVNATPHGTHPTLEVGYYDLQAQGGGFHSLGHTTSWNWQQGCRLQWLSDGERVIYNIFENGRFGARIQNVATGVIERTISEPVYGVSPDGTKALTLNFAHLHLMRPGYGYSQLPEQAALGMDGVWLVDLLNDTKTMLVGMEKIRGIDSLPEMDEATHYLNHLDFSPDGTRICFIHLWMAPQNIRGTRMIVCNVDGSALRVVTNEGRDSHHCWKTSNEFLMFAKLKETGARYNLFDLTSRARTVIGADVLREDGHPSYISPDLILSDTYPDRKRCQELFTFNSASQEKTIIAKFFSPAQFTGELRCDLHPRASADGKLVCVDMIHEDRRAMCLLNLDK